MTIEQLQAEYRSLTNDILPKIGSDRGHPVRLNHCFARIILDNLFGCCWYDRLERGRTPAYKQLTEEQLKKALEIGYSIVEDPGNGRCCELNRNSLQWRGKFVC